jgi:hypothetical protein
MGVVVDDYSLMIIIITTTVICDRQLGVYQ